MAGEGFIMDANRSIQRNRRESSIFWGSDQENLYGYEGEPFIPTKASKEKIKELEEKIARLKQEETERLYKIVVGLFVVVAGALIWFL